MAATEDVLRRHKGLRKYVLDDEKIIFATHRHWIRLWEPALTTVGSFAVFVLIVLGAESSMRGIVLWLFWGWVLVAGRFVWKFLEWKREWLLMTSLRMMTVTGFVVQRVATMPRDKVTDLGYRTNLLGQILGYGTFHFESAGQDQELSTVHYIPDSDALYRTLMADLFRPGGESAADTDTPNQDPRPTALPPSIMPRRGGGDEATEGAEALGPARSTPRTQQIRIRPAVHEDS